MMETADAQTSFLVVDDSKLSRTWAINMIPTGIKAHANIYEAANGQEAVDSYKEHRQNVVLMDLTMPVKDGFEALKEIIAFDPEAKVLIISADRQQTTRAKVIESGAIDILNKPIEKEALQKQILALLFN
jgi:two-component system chemotaxis response regulator CheY